MRVYIDTYIQLKVFFFPSLLVASLLSCLQSGSWGLQGWVKSVQYFANSTGIDDSFQASLKSAGKLVAELGIVTTMAARGPSVLEDWPFQLLPSAGAEGKETPSLPQELGHQLVCPYGEEMHKTPILTSQFLSYWACGKKCPIYHPLCSSFEREKHGSLPPIPSTLGAGGKKEKWSPSHLMARSCRPEQDKTIVPVF